MSRSALTLSGLLARTRLPLGERGLPEPASISRPGPLLTLPPDAPLTAAERGFAVAPLRGSRAGVLRWGDAVVRQSTERTCGALALLVLAAAGDPVLAAWLMTGRRVGGAPPPELAHLLPAQLALPTVAERLAAAELAVHTRARRRSLGLLDWPASFGTPPWAAAREARFRGVTYAHAVVHDHDVATTRRMLEAVVAATRLGIPVPLYTGGDLGAGGSPAAAVPRHVVLALPFRGREGQLRILEPSSGGVFAVAPDALLARTRPHAALGGWRHVVWAVLPTTAWSAGPEHRNGDASGRDL